MKHFTAENMLWVFGFLSLPTLYTIITAACDACARLIIYVRRGK